MLIRSSQWTLLFSFLLTSYGYSQSISGSISGHVVDQQGANVANAAVTVTEPTKNVQVGMKTGEGGDFAFTALQPGNYTVSVEAQGFKKVTRPNLALNANDKLGIGDIALEVGAVTETVEVSGQAALLQTESVERSATINSRQMENLEVNGRNPLDMAKLIPGVVQTANFSVGGVGGLSGLQVNGNRGTENQTHH
jgi:Carboxypeptidase regulatory-like domain